MSTSQTIETIQVGQTAPDFELPEARGGTVRLSDVVRERTAVLVFYRGGWCPICNNQLATLSQHYEKFRNSGSEILAISNEEVEKGLGLLKKLGPPFKLLHDPTTEVIRAYGALARQRDPLGIMKRKHNYAHPSIFIIDHDRVVRWKYVGKDYKDRPANDLVLSALSSLHSPQTELVKVAETGALQPGEAAAVSVNGDQIALFNVDGKFFAVQEVCPHKGGPIHEGTLDGRVVTCPWHHVSFDATNGKVLNIPFPPEYGTATDLKKYEVVERPDGVYISTR